MFFSKLKDYLKYLIPFILGVLIFAAFTNSSEMYAFASSALSSFFYVINKFILGFGLAYIIDFLVTWMQKRLKLKRGLSILLSYVLLLALIVGMVFYLIPPVYDNVVILVNHLLPGLSQSIMSNINDFIATLDQSQREIINEYVKSISNFFWTLISTQLNVTAMQSFIQSSTRFFIDLFFGIMISVYALLEKDSVLGSLKRVFIAISGKKRAESAFEFLRGTNMIFSQYMIGKFVDSSIICALSLICYQIFNLPLSPFLALIAGFFNMIPYFGPYIGGVITVVILLCIKPVYVVYALIIMVAIQTLDGFVIGPKMVGKYVGISPLMIIIAVCIGGDIGGFLGVFLSIPIFATIKSLIIDKQLEKRLKPEGDDPPDESSENEKTSP